MSQAICVIGSLNTDLTVTLPRFHLPGETITGTDFATYQGGKGGNQAVAAARLGARVCMVGGLGEDAYGEAYRAVLRAEGVDDAGVSSLPGVSSGIALIEVDTHGENRIVVVPGANAHVTPAQIEAMRPVLAAYDVFLLQLEIPMESVCYALRTLREMGKRVILDPAPAAMPPDEVWANVDYITPNEGELALLSGMPIDTVEAVEAAARVLLARGVRTVIAKMGKRGAMIVSADQCLHVPGFVVRAVDTTAAGDSFNAGFAVALSDGLPLPEAVRYANAVGALSTTGAGAQAAMPTREQVEALMREGSDR